MSRILTGTASWTDKTLLESGWYPSDATTAEDRLRYYASRFPLVEVDSSYYSLPAERSALLWADRTPANFVFDVKAFRIFTGHPTPTSAIPKRLREELPEALSRKGNVYGKELPVEFVDEMWDMFRRALAPLHEAGKLGAIFLQFPKWFFYGADSLESIESAKRHLPSYPLAVEFRQPNWMDDRHRADTLAFLHEHDIAYTCVDEPQGTAASVPPVAAVTSALAVVRFHGRRQDTWDKRNVGVEERFKYLYDEHELSEWVPKIEHLAGEAAEVHVLMNNCYADYGVRNAHQLGLLLEAAGVPTATSKEMPLP